MLQSAASLVNLLATPVALERIAWKTYYIWIATCAAQAVYYYFFMAETKGHTLEEMNEIFKQKNPKKASLVYEQHSVTEEMGPKRGEIDK
jgi:hypothetical protein